MVAQHNFNAKPPSRKVAQRPFENPNGIPSFSPSLRGPRRTGHQRYLGFASHEFFSVTGRCAGPMPAWAYAGEYALQFQPPAFWSSVSFAIRRGPTRWLKICHPQGPADLTRALLGLATTARAERRARPSSFVPKFKVIGIRHNCGKVTATNRAVSNSWTVGSRRRGRCAGPWPRP